MPPDLRFALRTLARTPGFTLVAVLSLALGIGANSAIFSVARALLLKPLPYANAERLVILWNTSPGLGITEDWFSTAQYFDIRNGSTAFDQLAIAIGGNENLTGQGDPARVGAIRVSSNLLSMLGARPSLGRLFLPEDDVPGRAGTAVLGHGTWTRRFGADPGVIGRAITLNGEPYTVVGVHLEGEYLGKEEEYKSQTDEYTVKFSPITTKEIQGEDPILTNTVKAMRPDGWVVFGLYASPPDASSESTYPKPWSAMREEAPRITKSTTWSSSMLMLR